MRENIVIDKPFLEPIIEIRYFNRLSPDPETGMYLSEQKRYSKKTNKIMS